MWLLVDLEHMFDTALYSKWASRRMYESECFSSDYVLSTSVVSPKATTEYDSKDRLYNSILFFPGDRA